MGYVNPLLKLPAMKQLMALPPSPEKRLVEQLCREIRAEANSLAEISWARRKAPMACYWRALSTYARHTAHALKLSRDHKQAQPAATADEEAATAFAHASHASDSGAGESADGPGQPAIEASTPVAVAVF